MKTTLICIHLCTFIDIPNKLHFPNTNECLNFKKIKLIDISCKFKKLMKCSFCKKNIHYDEDISFIGDWAWGWVGEFHKV